MPMAWRKFILTVSRVQQDPFVNIRLRQEADEIQHLSEDYSPYIICHNGRHFTFNDLRQHLSVSYTSPLLSSVLSYYTRAEIFFHDAIYSDSKAATIDKEISASIKPNRPQQLDYSALTSTDRLDTLFGRDRVPSEVLDDWKSGVVRFRRMMSSQDHIFIPHYQSKKNMGWRTQEALHFAQYSETGDHAPRHENHSTQRDLMIFYHQTGLQVMGPMEFRYTWRFNDLKGRAYYATGGSATWPSLFIKQVVKDILNLIPGTHVRLRYDATRVTDVRPLQDDEVLITYDYTSFTTSLSELKYFLTYLARQLTGISFRGLDLFQGIVEYDLGEYIHEYNLSINMNAIYDVSRITEGAEILGFVHQCRSGMLGVQGNIGFSTLNHGLAVSGLTHDPYCTVGDDTLFRTAKSHHQTAIERAQMLCEIEESKFHTWTSINMYADEAGLQSVEQAWQFLKRPLGLGTDNYVYPGYLPTFPGIAECLMPPDRYHAHSDKPEMEKFLIAAKQWGRMLHSIMHHYPDISPDESEILLQIMRSVYDHFEVPYEGLPVGSVLQREPLITCTTFVPPVTEEVFTVGWEELLCRYYTGTIIVIPRMIDFSVPAPQVHGVGHSFKCTMHRIQRVMLDLGYFEDLGVEQETLLLQEGE